MLILKEKTEMRQMIGLGLGCLGLIAIVLGERDFHSGSYLNLTLGIGLALLAALTFGLYTVLTKKTVLQYGNLLTNSISFILGALTLFVLNMILGKPVFFRPDFQMVAVISYLGIFVTGVAYILYFEGMKGLTAAKASQYFFLKPVLASVLAYLFLSEMLTFVQLMGMLFVIVSLSFKAVSGIFFPKKGIAN